MGNFKNVSCIWCQMPEQVNVHDFAQDALGSAVPYGIYDVQHNLSKVYVGRSADTATFAVNDIAHWDATERLERYSEAIAIMIDADNGSSNVSRFGCGSNSCKRKSPTASA